MSTAITSTLAVGDGDEIWAFVSCRLAAVRPKSTIARPSAHANQTAMACRMPLATTSDEDSFTGGAGVGIDFKIDGHIGLSVHVGVKEENDVAMI